jgi:hypothetical protein
MDNLQEQSLRLVLVLILTHQKNSTNSLWHATHNQMKFVPNQLKCFSSQKLRDMNHPKLQFLKLVLIPVLPSQLNTVFQVGSNGQQSKWNNGI